MRDVIFAIVLSIGALWLALTLAFCILDAHDQKQAQLRNAYWPYSVEMQVRDL